MVPEINIPTLLLPHPPLFSALLNHAHPSLCSSASLFLSELVCLNKFWGLISFRAIFDQFPGCWMMSSSGRSMRFPFTPSQWQELEHQALIYKYMVSGIPIPPDLLFSIKRSCLDSPPLSSKLFSPHSKSTLSFFKDWNFFNVLMLWIIDFWASLQLGGTVFRWAWGGR
jgi:hypothetical protein